MSNASWFGWLFVLLLKPANIMVLLCKHTKLTEMLPGLAVVLLQLSFLVDMSKNPRWASWNPFYYPICLRLLKVVRIIDV